MNKGELIGKSCEPLSHDDYLSGLFCEMDDPDNVIGKKQQERTEADLYPEGLESYSLGDAKEWVNDQVKKIISKICCCNENTGLFCLGDPVDPYWCRFYINDGGGISEKSKFSSHHFTPENMKSIPHKQRWTICCKRCEHTDFKLPVVINGNWVILPEGIFVFSKPFRSFVKMTDYLKQETVEEDRKEKSATQGRHVRQNMFRSQGRRRKSQSITWRVLPKK